MAKKKERKDWTDQEKEQFKGLAKEFAASLMASGHNVQAAIKGGLEAAESFINNENFN